MELVLFVACTLLMFIIQTHLSYVSANREIDLTYDDMGRILDQVIESSIDMYDSYEMIHAAKAKMAKFYIKNDEDTIYSTTSMKRLNELLDVYNVYITDANGAVKLTAQPSDIKDFSDPDLLDGLFFEKMQDVQGTNTTSSVLYYDTGEADDEDTAITHSLCAAYLKNGDYVIIEDDAERLVKQQTITGSWDLILSRITLARKGFAFCIDSYGTVSGFSESNTDEFMNINELGISMDDLKEGFRGTLNLKGRNYYCGIEYNESYEIYIICAIPTEEITSSVLVVTSVPLFVAFIFMSLQLLYSLMLVGEPREKGPDGKREPLRLFLFRKMAVLLALSFLFTTISSLYPQIMYAMYLQSDSNMREADAIDDLLTRNEDLQKQIRDKYYGDLETLTSLAAKFISNNYSQITRNDLGTIAKNLGAEHILLYNKNGTVILSDAYYSGLKLSTNPDDLSYEFRKVLTGTPVLAQNKIDKTYLETPYRYVGAIVTDSQNELNGIVQLLFSPDFLSASLSDSLIETIPSTFSGRNNAFAFIVDGETETFLYYPDKEYMDKPVDGFGITKDMMQHGYFSRVQFNGEKMLLYCDFWDEDLIFTAARVSPITVESISSGAYIALVGIVIQILFFLGMLLINKESPTAADSEDQNEWTLEDQKKLVEGLAAERIARLLRISFFAFSGVISAIFILKDILFKNKPVLKLLFSGHWNNGIHVFSMTACCVVVCIVYFNVSLILLILELIGKLMNSRGETIVRMLISFIRYIAVISMIFFCADLLGAPTGTLLASAGILTIVIGLGAQNLVTDILAGLFIIFEKVYKVGDIIMIGGETWRGRVLEIGIRNTRVMDVDANTIRILHNSSLNQIINMSELPTFVFSNIGIEYSEQLTRIEKIIESELPTIHERIPKAVEGPMYCGVTEFGDSAVILRFKTKCRNDDYVPVRLAVNRELKLMFDRHNINVPFPQVVINERKAAPEKEQEASTI